MNAIDQRAEKHAESCERFISIFNDKDAYPELADISIALGLSVQTIKNKAVSLRASRVYGGRIINRAQTAIPQSEMQNKITDSWSAEECVEELQRVSAADPEREMTRNYFRINGKIADSVWSVHFGTFEEFKRQSGLKLTRQQHGMERDIARHASVDHYRRISIERTDWGEKYLRSNSNRFKTILTCSDLHDIEIDRFYLRVLIDTAKRVQPDIISLVGDIFDLAEFGKYSVDPREWDVVAKIRFAHEFILGPLREACPDAQIDFIEGNHEARMLRQLADATPALRAVLSDLHGFTIGKLLGLEQFEINYIAKADLSAWSKRDFEKELANNYKVYYNAVMCHHFPHARNMGLPGVNGHHHSHQVWSMFNPIYGPYEWHQMGSGHKRSASYCEGEKWHNGFSLINVDTQTRATNFDYIPVTDFAVSGGKWYYRNENEIDGSVPAKLLM